jgi:hypothetical protein
MFWFINKRARVSSQGGYLEILKYIKMIYS